MKSEFNIVDLFCGCGGFGLGAEMAGFNSVVAVDIDPTLQSAYKRNFPNARVVNGDLAEFKEESWQILLNGVNVDGVIGGPPCQGYSRMGKSDVDDPRRTLLGHFFRNVNLIKPKFFVMENVEGLMDKRNVFELEMALKLLDDQYVVLPPMILDASDYGAPTKRKRVFLIGYIPSQVQSLTNGDFVPAEKVQTNVRDAIADLGLPTQQTKSNKDSYGWGTYLDIKELSEYAKFMRKMPAKGLGWSESLSKLKKHELSGFFDTTHTNIVRERYKATEPGTVDKVSRSKKLAWDGLCPTLRAGTGSDKGSYQAVRPLHPEQPRVITVREAARLQGFPDWFVFHPTKWHSFRMIGNSVSPLMSKSILTVIKNHIDPQSCYIENSN